MNQLISSQKRFIVAAFVALVFIIAVCFGSHIMKQSYAAHHYVTLTMEDNQGRITHERVSEQRQEQINRDANKMYKDITEQADRERKQKGLTPVQSQ